MPEWWNSMHVSVAKRYLGVSCVTHVVLCAHVRLCLLILCSQRIVDAHRHLVMELESVGFSEYSHEEILQPSRQHHCPASDAFSGHRSLQMFLLTDLLIFARTATGAFGPSLPTPVCMRADIRDWVPCCVVNHVQGS